MKKSGVSVKIKTLLEKTGKTIFIFDQVEPEVSVETVDRCCAYALEHNIDFIIGLGGGSALDCAKAAAGVFKSGKSVKEFIDRDISVESRPAYFIAIPTTAGTGSEVTKNSVLTYTEKEIKISLRGEGLVPDLVISDPDLTLTMGSEITAYTGMDALSHAVESYFSTGANKMTKVLSLEAITLILGNLAAAYKNGKDREARYNMMLGSLIAGLAFSNGGLGAVHGIGHPVGAICKKPHGLVNAVLMPHVLRFNQRKIKEESAKMNKAIGGDIIKKVESLNKIMDIPDKISRLDKDFAAKIDRIVSKTAYSGSMAYNPLKMDEKKVLEILRKAC